MNPLSIPTSCCRTNTWSYPGSGLTGPQDSPTKVLTTRFLKLRDLPKRNTRKEVYKPTMKVCINSIKSMRFTTSPHLNLNIWACHVHHGASLLFRFWAHFHSLQ